jgi:hypothetical protein
MVCGIALNRLQIMLNLLHAAACSSMAMFATAAGLTIQQQAAHTAAGQHLRCNTAYASDAYHSNLQRQQHSTQGPRRLNNTNSSANRYWVVFTMPRPPTPTQHSNQRGKQHGTYTQSGQYTDTVLLPQAVYLRSTHAADAHPSILRRKQHDTQRQGSNLFKALIETDWGLAYLARLSVFYF